MHIVYQITEEEIRSELNHAIQLLIDDEIIKFRSDYARREFLEDCVSVVLDKFDIYECSPHQYIPDYEEEVLNFAENYSLLVEVLQHENF